MRLTIAASTLAVLFLAGCCCAGGPAPGTGAGDGRTEPRPGYEPPPQVQAPDTTTLVEMRNVHFRIDENLALNIRHLAGEMQPLAGHDIIDFGAPESFHIQLAYAEIGMTPEHLAYLLNRYVFDYEGAPLTIHDISVQGGQLRQTGTLHKVVNIPFEMTADVSATDDGRIRLHPTAMEICNIPGTGLMDALGIELEDLLDLSQADGVAADGNDLLMDPRKLLPPPAIRGTVSEVRVDDGELVQIFGTPEEAPEIPAPSYPDAANYMFYFGSTLHFGKLFMVRADLQIIDEDPSDPFDFFLRRYMEQLVASHSETLPDAGLAAFFPDYADVARQTSR